MSRFLRQGGDFDFLSSTMTPSPLQMLTGKGKPADGMFPAVSSTSLRQTGVNTKIFRSLAESLVSCPQKCGWVDKDRGDQMCVGETVAEVV